MTRWTPGWATWLAIVAAALLGEPDILIADEPTTALDVTTQAQILDLLGGLVEEEGMSLLLITHDLAVVAGMADHVAVMQNGEIVEQGPTEPLFRSMTHPYTRKLFAASAHQPDRARIAEAIPLLTVTDALRDYRTPRQGLFGRPAMEHTPANRHLWRLACQLGGELGMELDEKKLAQHSYREYAKRSLRHFHEE